MDCDYFLGFGHRNEKFLHQLNVADQIKMMKELWNGFPEDAKPQWLSMEEILKYKEAMSEQCELC
jgi:hypothetical protein